MGKPTPMDEIPVHVCISSQVALDDEFQPWYSLSSAQDAEDCKKYGQIAVYSTTIRFPRPTREEVVPAQVEALRVRIEEVRAAAGAEVNKIEETIAKLLSIGYEGGES